MTVLSNVAVFLIFFVLLQLFPENRDFQFFLLGLSVLIVGSLATVIFHSGTPEGTLDSSGSENQTEESVKFNWWDWLKSRIYFQVAFIYMTTRIVVNVSQVFLPFFVDDVLEMHALNDQAITTVPLVLYISSFFGSLAMNRLNQKFGRRGGYILGGLVSIVPLISMFFLTKEVSYFVYVAVIVLGFGSSIIMVCSVSLESDLVGDRVSTGAFVFGSLSFTDKLSNGLIIFAIQNRDQVSKHIVMLSETLIPAAAAACGVIMAFFTVIPR
jgi:Na+/melibiose symporter-like transporter